jgi:hypothetical protein
VCVQSVSCCMICERGVSYCVGVCAECQLLYDMCTGCQLLCGLCTECQLKSHWEVLQQVGCIAPHMLSLPDVQIRKSRLKHSNCEENHSLPTVRFASNLRPHFPHISGLVQIRQIKYCDNNKNETAGKTTFL